MALFPCDYGPHRYAGPQRTIYPAVADGITTTRRKLRLCPIHFGDALGQLDRNARPAQTALDDDLVERCMQCQQPADHEHGMFYATVYDVHEERADWWAPVHATCLEPLMAAWLLEPE